MPETDISTTTPVLGVTYDEVSTIIEFSRTPAGKNGLAAPITTKARAKIYLNSNQATHAWTPQSSVTSKLVTELPVLESTVSHVGEIVASFIQWPSPSLLNYGYTGPSSGVTGGVNWYLASKWDLIMIVSMATEPVVGITTIHVATWVELWAARFYPSLPLTGPIEYLIGAQGSSGDRTHTISKEWIQAQ
jgi:hypothetical protein